MSSSDGVNYQCDFCNIFNREDVVQSLDIPHRWYHLSQFRLHACENCERTINSFVDLLNLDDNWWDIIGAMNKGRNREK